MIKVSEFKFEGAWPSVAEEEEFARFVIERRHLGFGRMMQIIGGLWDQLPNVGKMGTAHYKARIKGRKKETRPKRETGKEPHGRR